MEKDKELPKKDELVVANDKELQQQLRQQVICGDCVWHVTRYIVSLHNVHVM